MERGSQMKIYTMVDSFTVTEDAESTSRRILDRLNSVGLKADEIQTGIRARGGSDIIFRIFGIPLGSNSLPVGLDVQVSAGDGETTVGATAYDRLGWYMNRKLVWGENVVDRKLTGLLNEVRSATGQPELPGKRATFNP